jgi:hypothetical protein
MESRFKGSGVLALSERHLVFNQLTTTLGLSKFLNSSSEKLRETRADLTDCRVFVLYQLSYPSILAEGIGFEPMTPSV